MKINTSPLVSSFDKCQIGWVLSFCFCRVVIVALRWSHESSGWPWTPDPPAYASWVMLLQLTQYDFSDLNFQVTIITVRFPWNTQLFWIAGLKFFTITATSNMWSGIHRCILQQISVFQHWEKRLFRGQIRRWRRYCYS